MDTGAIIEQQMQDQIESGIAMMDAFDEWFEEMQASAFYKYGAEITLDEQGNYFTYFKRGWSPNDTASDCFGAKHCNDE